MEEKEVKSVQDYTKEELEKICEELSKRNNYLIEQLEKMNLMNMFKRLDYLFKVIELSNVIKDSEFTNKCIDEMKVLMSSPVDDNEAPEEDKDQQNG